MTKSTSTKGKGQPEYSDVDIPYLMDARFLLRAAHRRLYRLSKDRAYRYSNRQGLFNELTHTRDELIEEAIILLRQAKSVPNINPVNKKCYQEAIKSLNLAYKRLDGLLKTPGFYTGELDVILNKLYLIDVIVDSARDTLIGITL